MAAPWLQRRREGTPSRRGTSGRLRGLEGRARRSRPSPRCGLASRGSCEPATGRGRPHGTAVCRGRACPARSCLGRLLDRRGRDRLRDRARVVVDVGTFGRCPGAAARWHCGHRRTSAEHPQRDRGRPSRRRRGGIVRRVRPAGRRDPAPNAISVGRSPDRGVVFITSGLVLLLDRIELEAVLAHELAHIKRGDTVSGAIAVLAFDPLRRYIPTFARIADRVAGNGREPFADLAAVAVTRYPPGLISALEKIDGAPIRRPSCLPRSVAESTSRLWLAPFERRPEEPEGPGVLDLAERVAVLREL